MKGVGEGYGKDFSCAACHFAYKGPIVYVYKALV